MHPFEQRIEIGPWFEVGQRLDGAAVQRHLAAIKESNGRLERPCCIYIHVPFCPSRCSYCALYTREVKYNQDQVFDEYLEMVKRAIAAHPNAHQLQPPTTVHFGGGTPLAIGPKRFGVLTGALRNTFGDSSECEWAVETTTSSITPEVISALKDLRFRRIHLGIQTLDEKIRKLIGRRESGEKAIEKIHLLNANDFLLSVDLIIGFDNSTEAILMDDLNRLYAAGIRMFSICELRTLRGNKVDERQRQEEINRNYKFWQAIWQFMQEHQLIPIHLGQFARWYEDNLYFTHPARGEDCIAIGPYAHGSAGRMYYANKLLPHYYHALQKNQSPIEFGVLYDDDVQKIRDLESQLLAHRVLPQTIDEVATRYHDHFTRLLHFWLEHGLLVEDNEGKSLALSREGSWFAGNMISQARQLVHPNAPTVLKKDTKVWNGISFNDNYSKGCQSCQQGKWVCIYLTYLCNAKCAFCPAPFKQEDKIISAFGDDPAAILKQIQGRPFNGISFSGGDCFLVFERLLEWLTFFKKHRPKIYYWAYTNGLAVDEGKLRQLASAGLDELRFNIAATNYHSPRILEKIALATRLIKSVAVEVPSIPEDYQKLVAVLPDLDRVHVKYLNLHEYILVPDDPRSKTAVSGTFILNKETELKYDVNSLQNTKRIKQFCRKQKLKIQVNNCSLRKKENQMLQRRLAMGSLFKKDYEQLTPDGLLRTCLVYPKKLSGAELQNLINASDSVEPLERYFMHPQAYEEEGSFSQRTVAKLSFLPPLDIHGKRVRIQTEVDKL